MKVELQKVEVRRSDEFERAFSRMAKNRVDAVVVAQDSVFNANVRAIADLAAKNRLPSSGTTEFAEAGDKILRGVKPNDIPVEQATTFELVINLKTAKALALTIPQSHRCAPKVVHETTANSGRFTRLLPRATEVEDGPTVAVEHATDDPLDLRRGAGRR